MGSALLVSDRLLEELFGVAVAGIVGYDLLKKRDCDCPLPGVVAGGCVLVLGVEAAFPDLGSEFLLSKHEEARCVFVVGVDRSDLVELVYCRTEARVNQV